MAEVRLDSDWEVEGLWKTTLGRSVAECHAKFKFMFRAEREAEVGLLWESGREESVCIRGADRKRGVTSGEKVIILPGGLGKRKWATIPKGKS